MKLASSGALYNLLQFLLITLTLSFKELNCQEPDHPFLMEVLLQSGKLKNIIGHIFYCMTLQINTGNTLYY